MALKSSKTGSLPVSEIYSFMTEHFPYFKVPDYVCFYLFFLNHTLNPTNIKGLFGHLSVYTMTWCVTIDMCPLVAASANGNFKAHV